MIEDKPSAAKRDRIPAKHGKEYVDSLNEPGYYVFSCSPSCSSSCKLRPPSGFGVRVTAAGKKMYYVYRKLGGTRQSVRVSIDYHGNITHDEAKKRSEEISAKLGRGENPNLEKKQAQAADEQEQKRHEITLRKVFIDCYQIRTVKPSTLEGYSKVLNRCVPDWMERPVVELEKSEKEILERYQELSDIQRTPDDYRPKEWKGIGQANLLMRILNTLFNFARSNPDYKTDGKPLVEHNPISILSALKARKELNSRSENYIALDRVREWHEALLQVKKSIPRDCVRLMLFTGLRDTETKELKWADVTFDHKAKSGFFIARNTKNGTDHKVPMTPYTYKLLYEHSKKKRNEYVFWGSGTKGHIVDVRKALQQTERATGIKCCPHELRRTFATIADEVGIEFNQIQKLMNHTPKDVTNAHYLPKREDRLRRHLSLIEQWILTEAPTEQDLIGEMVTLG